MILEGNAPQPNQTRAVSLLVVAAIAIPSTTLNCPYDQTPLKSDPPHLSVPNIMGKLDRTCPKCQRDFTSSKLLDSVLVLSNHFDRPPGGDLPAWAAVPIDHPTGVPAESQFKELRDRVEKLHQELARLSATQPAVASAEDIARISGELRLVQAALDEAQRTWAQQTAEAKNAWSALLPDVEQLAYLKVAKADVTAVRNLVVEHIEDSHKRTTMSLARNARTLSVIAIVVSIIGLIVALVRTSQGA